MDHTDDGARAQEGIDPLVNESSSHRVALPLGWAAVPVANLRKQGVSLTGIGLAAAMIMRDEGPSTEERLATIYGLDKLQRYKLFRELIIAGFLEIRAELYHINAGGHG